MKDAEKGTNRKDMWTRTIKVVTGNITNWEEDMFEQEVKEETVNEVGVLIGSCEVRNVDEEGGDSEAGVDFEKRMMRGDKAMSNTS